MSHIVRRSPFVFAVILSVVLIALLFTARKAQTSIVIDQTSVLAAAAEIGVAPECLAASGLAHSAQSIYSRLLSATTTCEIMAQQRQAMSDASTAKVQAQRQLAINPGSQELQAALSQANSELAAAEQALASAREQLRATVFQGLGGEALAQIQTYQQNMLLEVPPAFRVLQRSAGQWHDIQMALIAERRAQRLGSSLDSDDQTLLQQLRADPEVIHAQQLLDQNLPAMLALFNQSFGLNSGSL